MLSLDDRGDDWISSEEFARLLGITKNALAKRVERAKKSGKEDELLAGWEYRKVGKHNLWHKQTF